MASDHAARTHSSVVGGSSAERRLSCPASYRLEQQVDERLRSASNDAADEGEALHEAIEFLLRTGETDATVLHGREFGKGGRYVMTAERIEEALQPAIDAFDEYVARIEDEDASPFEMVLERKVQMPGIPDAHGTLDLLGRTAKRTVALDWKFGAGKPVYVTRKDGTMNAQLAFYARAAMHVMPDWFKATPEGRQVDGVIVQPRRRDDLPILTSTRVTVADLEKYRVQLIAAVAEAVSTVSEPRMAKGDHCAFAACKVVCPLHTGALVDLSKLRAKAPQDVAHANVVLGDSSLVARLPDLLEMAELTEDYIAAIRAAAHVYLEAGHKLDGWVLKPKRAMRNWIDPSDAMETLRAAGLDDDELFEEPELRSPAQIEKTLKKRKLTDLLRRVKASTDDNEPKAEPPLVAAISSGTTLARDTDKRPTVEAFSTRVGQLLDKIASRTG